ncbi:MAG: NlpC/P60 family protein [Candidatus Micrarchaeia archaeon]|jgi:hypothetical protein
MAEPFDGKNADYSKSPAIVLDEIERFKNSLKKVAKFEFTKSNASLLLYKIGVEHGIDSKEFLIAEAAMAGLGAKYVFGAKDLAFGRVDCGGLIYSALCKVVGISLGRESGYFGTVNIQASGFGRKVGANELDSIKTGDIISRSAKFGDYGHAVIVLNNDPESKQITVIHASSGVGKVNIHTYPYADFKSYYLEKNKHVLAISSSEYEDFVKYFKTNFGTIAKNDENIANRPSRQGI